MLCVKYAKKTSATILFNVFSKSWYSRRSDKNTDSYKIVQANSENLNGKCNRFFATIAQQQKSFSYSRSRLFPDVDGAVLGINSNWELLTPRGFRFYLPGSIGPGWSDVTTTIQVRTELVNLHPNEQTLVDDPKEKSARLLSRSRRNNHHPELRYVAQECPLLLRKGIEELFPGCLDVGSPQLTIVTVSQSINPKVMKWNKEIETEKLAKYVSMYDFIKFYQKVSLSIYLKSSQCKPDSELSIRSVQIVCSFVYSLC